MKAQGAEKRGFGFPNGMRFREQIGAQFFGTFQISVDSFS
jgi:hypothetical protein